MSSADPSQPTNKSATHPYAGWVPTVNGRLSFRHIGETKYPQPSIYANVINDDERIILAYQRRPLSDVLFQSLVHQVRSLSGDFWFALAIKSDEQPLVADNLRGSVYIYKSKEDWRTKAQATVRSAINEINELRYSADGQRADGIRYRFQEAVQKLDETCDINLSFQLHRTGEVTFSLPSFLDSDLQYASEDFATQCGHDFAKWVADQAYFFLRDACHNHQHHHPASDTILILQDRDDDDVQWRKKVIYSLYYAIIRAKRSGHAFSVFQSIGVQAYCMSFKSVCEERLGKDAVSKFPNFSDAALRQSLDAKAQELMADATMSFSRAANLRTFVLALTAIFIAAIAILVQPRIGHDADRTTFPALHLASDIAATYFLWIVFLCFVAIIFVWLLTRSGWMMLRFPWGRDLLEASNVRRARAIILFFLLSIIVAAVTVWLNWAAVLQIWQATEELGKSVLGAFVA